MQTCLSSCKLPTWWTITSLEKNACFKVFEKRIYRWADSSRALPLTFHIPSLSRATIWFPRPGQSLRENRFTESPSRWLSHSFLNRPTIYNKLITFSPQLTVLVTPAISQCILGTVTVSLVLAFFNLENNEDLKALKRLSPRNSALFTVVAI